MSDLTERLSALTPKQRELLLRKTRKERADNVKSLSLQIIPQERGSAGVTLSFAQERLWFLHQFESSSTAYIIPAVLRIHGPLSLEALQRSFSAVTQRHESLRTTFRSHEEHPVQVIARALPLVVTIVDLRNGVHGQEEVIAEQLIHQEIKRPFDLTIGPLLRVHVIWLHSQEYLLVLAMHHIIADGWSINVLIRELSQLYLAEVQGEVSPLLPLPIQYADYALWQRQRMQGEIRQQLLDYWTQQLAGAPQILNLPTDHPRVVAQSFAGTIRSRIFPPDLVQKLQALSLQEGVTLFMTLLASFQILLMRYSGQFDIVVGTPIANRTGRNVEEIVGVFINTLVLRTDLSGDPDFRQLLARVRQVMQQAYAHQDLPFEQLVEALQPERSLSHTPIFQVLFAMQNLPITQMELAGVTWQLVEVGRSEAKFDLNFDLRETSQGLSARIEYNAGLFEAETIERLFDHWLVLLEGIVANSAQALSRLPLLSEAEQQTIISDWNTTWQESFLHGDLVQLLSSQAEATPDQVAVVFAEYQLTYRELHNRANQLARYLQHLGIGPDVLVGVSLKRSLDLVVALLAILKAGGAYVPLDPSYPSERLRFMLQECQAALVLAQRSTRDVLGETNARMVCLDEEWEDLVACEPVEPVVVEVQPEHLAYVIYTSGSTGHPKGVGISRQAVSNFLQSMREQPGLDSQDRLLAVTTISFDIAGLELFLPLCVGSQVVLNPAEVSRDGQSLAQLMEEQAITVMQATPTTWQLLVLAGWQGSSTLKALCGGEALPSALAMQLEQRCAEVWNMYGPTETTIWSTCSEVRANAASISIGRPIANTQLYIRDQQENPVPVGVPGELSIGGAGVARGYLNRPDLTAERFVPDPWSLEPGARLYRTGDQVRYHANGSVEHLGRMDRQVKIRGYRIEVGEIEAVLRQELAVREAVVQVQEEATGGKRLVAYVVGQPGQPLNLHEIRGHILARLPAYMVPSAFVVLEALPLTPNGKVDLHGLPLLEVVQKRDEHEIEPPGTPLEELLSGVWSSVLSRKQIGRHENFFEIGGHSLLATQLIGRVRQLFKIEMPLRSLFEAPTVARFVQRIEQSLRQSEVSQVPPLVGVARPEKLPFSYAQQRLWFLEQLEPGNLAYILPSALRVQGVIDVEALEQSVQKLLDRHESLRTTFVGGEEEPRQLIHPVSSIRLPVIDLQGLGSKHREQEVQRLTSQEAHTPFDVATGPLLRITLLRLASQEHVLFLTLHHIITDGWSMEVLVRDLTSLYQAQVRGTELTLPVLPIQYADYALWQRNWLQGEVLERQLTYWREQLVGAPALLELPTDHPRPSMQASTGARLARLLAPELLQQLQELSLLEGVTLFMTLLAAFQVLLLRYSGQTDIVVGSPIANRTHIETEQMIGFFVNTLALRGDLSGQPSFRELLARVREVTLQGYAHQDLPFEKLVDALQIERSLSHAPLFQVSFILQNVPQTALEIDGLSWQAVEFEHTATKFDLTLELRETRQGLSSLIEYNSALFEATTIERLLDHWRVLLEGIVADPSRSLAQLPLLSEAERQLVVYDWNKTQQEPFLHGDLVQLLASQVAETPDRIAVAFDEQQLTYGELHTRANRLAHYLQRLGIGLDALVGVSLERSLDLVVALLAILKAGGAYVPLDPEYPQERLRYMLHDAHIAVLLTHSPLQEHLPLPDEPVTILNLDLDVGLWADEALDDLFAIPQPEQLAYMIYTSGSTGQPKGAMNTHEGISNRLLWMQQTYQLRADDSVLQKTSFSFDVSVWELFWPLLCGARLVMARPGGQGDSGYLKVLLQEQQISTLHFVPSMLQAFLLEPELQECRSLRLVICSGEALTAELQARFFAAFPAPVQLHNLYGPTEAAVDVTYWSCQRELHTTLVPIGRPIANIEAYVLDASLSAVPIGVPGDLYLGGIGLARGYAGRADLTAEHFGPHPFSSKPGARLYRTGDLARYRADGELEFLGRGDQQVKLRGFRIELGEIEAMLQAHSAVQSAVVVLREETEDRKYLVAYVVPQEEQDADFIDLLRVYLLQHLPEYMVPAFFLLLAALPLTPNGKLDRRLLPAPLMALSHSHEVRVPETAIDRVLAQIWQRVLGLEQVGAHDNFFALGGDSILSLQVVARARQAGFALTPKQIFQYQTLAQLAAVATHIGSSDNEQLVGSGSVPLTPIQHYFFQRALPRWQHFNQALLLQVPADWDGALLLRVFESVLFRYDALRLRYEPTAHGWVQSLVTPEQAGEVPFARVDLRMLSQGEQAETIEGVSSQVQARLDPQHGPMMRILLFELGEPQSARLLIVAHHLVIDGVSWRVLLEDVQTAIHQLRQGETVHLPASTISFQRWAQYLGKLANAIFLRNEQDYWLRVVQAPMLQLPLDLDADDNGTRFDERRVSCALTQEETLLLLRDAIQAYHCQPQELLLVALLQALADWIGTRSIRLDLEGHGREDPAEEGLDVSRTLGWFTTLYPMLFTLPVRADTGEWIRAVKEQLRAVPHKGIGYGLLRYLSEDTEIVELLETPSSQIIFNYWGQFDQGLAGASGDEVRSATEQSGSVDAPENPRSHLLSVSGMVMEKELQLWLTYSAQAHLNTTIEALADAFLRNLRALLVHCLSPDAGGYTPSDFPLARLKQEALDLMLAEHQAIEDLYPLTPLQQGMLFHTLYAPQSGVYVEQMLCRLHGELDLAAFERAWQVVIAQHPILRTSFVWQGLNVPLQRVWKRVDLPVSMVDWRDRSSEQQQADLETFLQQDRVLGFDPGQVPLMRLTLIRLSATVSQVIWSHHHLLLDGWSTSIVLQEVFACYTAYANGLQCSLEPRRPYRDYLAWLQKQDLQEAETYWREVLAGISSVTPLGIDRSGLTGVREEGYAEEELRLTAEETAHLLAFTRQEQLTLNTLIQGVWAILLSHYSGQSNLLFGNVVAGRPPELAGAESMVGVFINTLPVRILLRAEDTVREWLKHLQEQQVEQRQYAYSSLVQVQGWSEISHDQQLFESLFVFENYPLERALSEQESALIVDAVQSREQTNYPLTIVAFPGQELRVSVRYERQRFAQPIMQQLLQHMHTMLEQMVADPELRLADLTVFTSDTRRELIETWNDTQVVYERELTLHQLFEQQVERTPDAVALVYEERHLTYQDLNARANQLAYYLRAHGVSLDQPVGLFMSRSLEVLIGLLGILKAGGAYVPLDASYPVHRLAFVVRDVGLTMFLTETAFLSSARELTRDLSEEVFLLCLDQPPAVVALQATNNPQSGSLPGHLAYVMYTSGSTGQPKGVALAHGALYNLLIWQEDDCPLRPGTVVVQFSPLGFDASCQELFSTWLRGGKIIELSSDEMRRDPEALLSLMAREQVERWFVPYAGLQNVALWATQHAQTAGVSLRAIMTAGEQLQVTPAIVNWLQSLPDCTLYNYYGPTESHVVTTHTLYGKPAQWPLFPPIGRPIANTQIYLLDRNLQPVPIGVAGELYIGGNSLARGYIHRPDWTAERFVPNMWSREPGARLYRTGDLARYDQDGVIEFLGRVDMQVKLRGYRIEPGEIETILQAHPNVREAVVVLRERASGEKFLVAYVVAQPGTHSSHEELRALLRQQVPDYMVPASLVSLEVLPLTPSGKIDRRALPAPDTSLLHDGVIIGPRTPLEELVGMIWAGILHLAQSQLSIYDNFFALGGHSLLATQVISRLRQSTQVDVPLRLLFEAPTMVMLARQIELLRQGGLQSSVPPLLPVVRSQALPLSFAQERLWFLQQLEPLSSAYHIPVALRLRGSLNIEVLEWSLLALIERHESLRTTFSSHEGQLVQVIAPSFSLDVPVIDIGALPLLERGKQLHCLLQQVSQVSFDLAHGPLLCLYLLLLGEQDQVLTLNMHHIITDGWSSQVLVRDLTALYHAQMQGRSPALPALPIQYADYALWQRNWLQGEVLEQQVAYWKQQLTGAPPLLELPTDHPRPAVQTFVGARYVHWFSPEVQQGVQHLSQQEGVTLFMTLLAAFQVLLLRYSGQHDIVVGTPIANRTRAEIEEVLGLFVNTLVLRSDLSGNPRFRELLARVREVTLQAYSHQDLPFEQVVEAVQVERSLSYPPLFQVLFVLQNMPRAALEVAGVTWEALEMEQTTAKFDLSLYLQEDERGLQVEVEYNTALFEEASIARLLEHWQVLLRSLVAEPEQRIEAVPLLTQGEREQILVQWNQTTRVYELPLWLHERFEQQVTRTPEAIAVVFEEEHLSYAELNGRANRLALELQVCGVGPDVLVGICLERSAELVVAVLAVFKSGGAYVPFDPLTPVERLAALVEDAGVRVVLTMSPITERFAPSALLTLQVLNVRQEQTFSLPSENATSQVQAENLAYMIYTSGSTGKPKGVMNTHRGISNRLAWMMQSYPLAAPDRVVQKTPMSFDVSLWELFWPLLTGATLVVAEPGGHQDPRYLKELVQLQAVTTLHFVPTMLQAFLEELDLGAACGTLRQVFCSGEALTEDLQARFFACMPESVSLQNLYGPTEAAIEVTFWSCTPGEGSVPIGRPIANTQMYILDEGLQPVPTGVRGELYIGGVNVARGYHGRADWTAERFVPDGYGLEPGGRLYRTGDLARYRADGAIEYLGRLDQQVKVRGVRIELGEIEATLRAHPAVTDAIVILREEREGRKYLMAYIVSSAMEEALEQQLQMYVRELLPEYMVPSRIVSLPSLPVTANGKVDTKMLPTPERVRILLANDEAPRSSVERTLADIWQQVLGLDQIGIHDNFFALGGDSIQVIQIVTRARQAGLKLTPKQLFRHQTIVQLTSVVVTIDDDRRVDSYREDVIAGPVPLTPIQHWFFEHNLPQPQYFNQALLLQVPSQWNISLLQSALTAVVRQHDALHQRFLQTDEGWQQEMMGSEEMGEVLLELIDVSAVPLQEQRAKLEKAKIRLQSSLDFVHGPLLRVAYITPVVATETSARVLFVVHHLVIDGVSWRILLDDLHTAMQQLLQNKVVQLPARTATFQQWSLYLQRRAREPWLQQELPYWLYAAHVPVTPLPLDLPDGKNIEHSIRYVQKALSVEETDTLLHRALRPYHCQIQDLLLVALLQTLANWTNGSRHVRIDLEGHGREELGEQAIDVSRTVGWFTSIYPVAFTLPDSSASLSEWIISIKEQVRSVPNKGLGYGLLRYLSQQKDGVDQLRSVVPAQLIFNYLGQLDQVVLAGDADDIPLQIAPEPVGEVIGPDNPRAYLLDVSGLVVNGQFRITWSYSEHLHHASTIEALSADFMRHLRTLLDHCLLPRVGAYTPSDFPLARLTQVELNTLLASVNVGLLEDMYPLTPMQQGMLFHSLLEPNSGVYLMQLYYTLRHLNLPLFAQAWQRVIAQQAILRTSFIWQDLPEPLQMVWSQVPLPITTLDWRTLSAEQQVSELQTFLQADRARGFDVLQAPLMRLTVIHLGEQRTHSIWTHHHLLLDGWSLSLLIQELFACYYALTQGLEPRLEQRRPYHDYIAWSQKQQQEQRKAYWREYLLDFSASTALGIDRGKKIENVSGLDESLYARHELAIATTTVERWQEMARQHQLTLNTLLQGAWAFVLARYSGQSDVVFGTVVAGRPPELDAVERMIGLFINTLPVRVQLASDLSVISWLQQLQAQMVDQRQYEQSALVEVQGWSEIPRDQPLFESLLVFENYPVETILSEQHFAVEVEAQGISTQTNYPLTITVVPQPTFTLRVTYQNRRFVPSVMQRLLFHLQQVVEQFVRQPTQQLALLELLTARERQHVLVEINATAFAYPPTCLHTLFEQQVARMPDAIALVCADEQVTYASLNQYANQLAHYLRSLGVGPEVPVGICLDHAVAMIIAVLACLKAGGFYLSIDPAYPSERCALMLEDAGAQVVITHTRYEAQLPLHLTSLCMDRDWAEIMIFAIENPLPHAHIDNAAYVLYTSGSTGVPKGVIVEHRNILNYVMAVIERADLFYPGVYAMLQPLSVDSSLTMLFPPLITGGVLQLIAREQALDIQSLKALFTYYPVDYLKIAPSHLMALMVQNDALLLSTLRRLIIGGEASQWRWVQMLRDALPQGLLYNHYGPTETTVGSLMYPVLPDVGDEGHTLVPIGRPLANTQIYILDDALQPVPMGVVGELYISGAGLARGYLKRPATTAERFVPHPFASTPGARLYKTGDLVRMLEDSTIEYVGRNDEQVKIRGYRIELGEIETVLCQHEAVRETIVLAQESSSGEKQLVAYLVAQEQADTLSTTEVRRFLRTHLPEQMVPSILHCLDALPLTSHGKVDRRALARLDLVQPEPSELLMLPQTSVEIQLAALWSKLLQVSQIGIHQNFFELGGHSLIATRLLSHIQSEFAISLPLRSLFEATTIAEMALLIEQRQHEIFAETESDELAELLAALEELSEDDLSL